MTKYTETTNLSTSFLRAGFIINHQVDLSNTEEMLLIIVFMNTKERN